MRVKVCDFGLSRDSSKNLETLKKLCGTYAYLAPEVFNCQITTMKSDIFSMGIVIWEVLNVIMTHTYSAPYEEYHFDRPFQILVQSAKGLRPNIPIGTPDPFVVVYQHCIDGIADSRPSAIDVVQEIIRLRSEYRNNSEQYLNSNPFDGKKHQI